MFSNIPSNYFFLEQNDFENKIINIELAQVLWW
jgi:hypothetical protein